MDAPIPPSSFWGKLHRSPEGEITGWHPLVDHCTDVAWTLRSMLDLPALRRPLQACTTSPLGERELDRLAVIGFLHDTGKCNNGFQAKRGHTGTTAGHTREIAGLFASERQPEEWRRLLGAITGWFANGDADMEAMLIASISHHGRPISGNDLEMQPGDPSRWWRPAGSLDPMDGVVELARSVREEFPSAFDEGGMMLAEPAFQHRFAGLLMLADWIASDTSFFPFRSNEGEQRAELARTSAKQALASIGLIGTVWQHDIAQRSPSFLQVFDRMPRPLQKFIEQDLAIDDDARLVLLESETGSGKTEAALIWFLRLLAANRVDGLYFALPTRVAARELYGRIRTTIDAAFPDVTKRPSPVLMAVPGYAKAEGNSMLPEPSGALWPDRMEDVTRESVWAAEHPKRFLAAPVSVGTIDQALLSALQVRHAHLRSVCLDRHLLVVDEVHASDPYMREILATLLRRHCGRGGHALLLSATLGDSARTHLFGANETPLAQARTRDYPLVSTLGATYPVASPVGGTKRVRIDPLEHLDTPDALVPMIVQALAEGARILVVLNTVKRANALLRAVESTPDVPVDATFRVEGTPCPHHGRFARADRELLDAAVSLRLGPGSPCGPVLVIGTQTLEQSLDIDADWLITDVCPMDVLLQRLGRLHRHAGRARPAAHRTPRASVLIPTEGDFARFIDGRGKARGPGGIGSVYADARILQCTTDRIQAQPEIELPRDNRALVEDALHRESLAALASPAWERHAQHLNGNLFAQLRQAEIGALEEVPFGACQFRTDDGPIVTRLGANDRRVRLPSPTLSPFGATIQELLIPGHMARDTLDDEATDLACDPEGFRFSLGGRSYRYSRFGLELLDA